MRDDDIDNGNDDEKTVNVGERFEWLVCFFRLRFVSMLSLVQKFRKNKQILELGILLSFMGLFYLFSNSDQIKNYHQKNMYTNKYASNVEKCGNIC